MLKTKNTQKNTNFYQTATITVLPQAEPQIITLIVTP